MRNEIEGWETIKKPAEELQSPRELTCNLQILVPQKAM